MTARETSLADLERLAFYATPPHPCAYLDGRQAITLFADPRAPMTPTLYSRLAEYGFRRSGEHVYRPQCPHCQACVSVRVPVAAYRPNRSQRRIWKRNSDLSAARVEDVSGDEYFRLYRRYMSTRHAGGSMDDASIESYLGFLSAGWSETWFVEFRLRDNTLLSRRSTTATANSVLSRRRNSTNQVSLQPALRKPR